MDVSSARRLAAGIAHSSLPCPRPAAELRGEPRWKGSSVVCRLSSAVCLSGVGPASACPRRRRLPHMQLLRQYLPVLVMLWVPSLSAAAALACWPARLGGPALARALSHSQSQSQTPALRVAPGSWRRHAARLPDFLPSAHPPPPTRRHARPPSGICHCTSVPARCLPTHLIAPRRALVRCVPYAHAAAVYVRACMCVSMCVRYVHARTHCSLAPRRSSPTWVSPAAGVPAGPDRLCAISTVGSCTGQTTTTTTSSQP